MPCQYRGPPSASFTSTASSSTHTTDPSLAIRRYSAPKRSSSALSKRSSPASTRSRSSGRTRSRPRPVRGDEAVLRPEALLARPLEALGGGQHPLAVFRVQALGPQADPRPPLGGGAAPALQLAAGGRGGGG